MTKQRVQSANAWAASLAGLDAVGWRFCAQADAEHRASSRQFMHVFHHPDTICVAHAATRLSDSFLCGLFAHEYGHLIASASGLGDGEREADAAWKATTGLVISYSEKKPGWKKGLQYMDLSMMNPVMQMQRTTTPKLTADQRRWIKRAFALFKCLWPHLKPQAACLFLSACLAGVYNALGPGGMLVQAGTAEWRCKDPEQDDGGDPNWGYVWSPEDSEESLRVGRLPEMHCWCTLPSQGVVIDPAAKFFLAQARDLSGVKWVGEKPPEILWVSEENWPDRAHYVADPRATAFAYELIRSDARLFGAYQLWMFKKGEGMCPGVLERA